MRNIEAHIFFNGHQNQHWLNYYRYALDNVASQRGIHIPAKPVNTTKRAEVDPVKAMYVGTAPNPGIVEMVLVESNESGKYEILATIPRAMGTYSITVLDISRATETLKNTLQAIDQLGLKPNSSFNWWLLGGLTMAGGLFYYFSKK